MNTLLIPTDFSDNDLAVARYALAFAQTTGYNRVLLYHVYQLPITGDPMMPSLELLGVDELKTAADRGMHRFMEQLQVPASIQLDTLNEYNVLEGGIADLCRQRQVGLIVMGITQGSDWEDALLGSNTLSVAKEVQVPVLAVPPRAPWQGLQTLVMAVDYKEVKEHFPTAQLKAFLELTGARLSILHVDADNDHLTMEQEHQRLFLEDRLADLPMDYHHVRHTVLHEAVNQFAQAQQAQCIGIVVRRHGWLEGLFRKDHGQEIATHAQLPLLMVH